MLKFFATSLGAITGLTALVITLKLMVEYSIALNASSTVQLVGILLLAASIVLLSYAVGFVSLIAIIGLTRGPTAIEWLSPNECTSKKAWFASSWDFFGASGKQQGVRIVGVGIAFKGTLA